MSFPRNEDTANMFRTRKPSVTRTKHDKPNLVAIPELQPQVPHAIVPDLVAVKKETCAHPAHAVKPEALPLVKCNGDDATKELPKRSAPPTIAPDQPMDLVHHWERTLEYKPFFSDDSEEDLYREVRADRAIEMGNDPLIKQILDMFPETSKDN